MRACCFPCCRVTFDHRNQATGVLGAGARREDIQVPMAPAPFTHTHTHSYYTLTHTHGALLRAQIHRTATSISERHRPADNR